VKSIIVDIFVLELEISTKTTSFSLLLFQKKLFLKKFIYLYLQYTMYGRCFSTILFRRISFQKHVQHR
jgi:hypothetical protein